MLEVTAYGTYPTAHCDVVRARRNPSSSPEPAAGAAEGKHAGMVLIPAGEFTMGREGGGPGEGPAHKLFLPAFFIDRNLVTMKQYARFIRAKGSIGAQGRAVSGRGG